MQRGSLTSADKLPKKDPTRDKSAADQPVFSSNQETVVAMGLRAALA
jgi:hypothetical protein